MSRALRRKPQASCGSKLPSVEPGKNPTFGIAPTAVGQGKRRGKIRRDRIDAEIGEILAQGARLRVQEVAGNIDRDIGAEIAALQQQADLGGGAGAEFHQRGALGMMETISSPRPRKMPSSVRVG